jgi:hypothetical protein
MKYNLTNETYLAETIRNFPGAPEMTILDMLIASIYLNIISLIISFVIYYPIVFIFKKILPKHTVIRLIVTGIFLTLTTPVFYFWASGWAHNDYYLKKAKIIAWILTFLISIIVYFIFNKQEKLKPYKSSYAPAQDLTSKER